MRHLIRPLAIMYVKYLQYQYKKITEANYHNQTNRVLAHLKLINAKIYYMHTQLSPWGYFHPSSTISEEQRLALSKLFKVPMFRELETVVWYKPEAVTYYHNKIWNINRQKVPIYHKEINQYLIENENNE